MKQKYFKSRAAAFKACEERNRAEYTDIYKVWRMPKGSRHPKMFAVCTDLEFINTY